MKHLPAILVVFFLLGSIAIAQEPEAPPEPEEAMMRRLGISEEKIQILTNINEETVGKVRTAQAEVEIYKARLKRLLLNANVDLEEVEKLLKEAMNWEIQIRFAQIQRETQMRRILGERQFQRMMLAMNRIKEEREQRIKDEIKRWNPERIERLRDLLRELMELVDGIDR